MRGAEPEADAAWTKGASEAPSGPPGRPPEDALPPGDGFDEDQTRERKLGCDRQVSEPLAHEVDESADFGRRETAGRPRGGGGVGQLGASEFHLYSAEGPILPA